MRKFLVGLSLCYLAFHPVSGHAAQSGILPSQVTLAAGQRQQFTLKSVPASSSWVWSVAGVVGGNSTVGTVSESGLYTAPSSIGARAGVSVAALAIGKSSKSSLTLTAAVLLAPSSVTVTPSSAKVVPSQSQRFTAKLPGSVSPSSLAWSLSPQIGSISSDGVYTAPASVSTSWEVTVTAMASGAEPGTATVALVPPSALAITTSTLPGGTTGTPYQSTLSAAGGTPPYSWSVGGEGWPAGIGIGTTTGVLSGTPTTAGSYNMTVALTDSVGVKASAVFALFVAAATCAGCPSFSIMTGSLPAGTVGAAYSATMLATGGVSPYRWSISSGQLPTGLQLDATSGKITGTPTAAGSFWFTASAKDAGTPQQTTSKALSATITGVPVTDQYGGNTAISCSGGVRGHFYTEKIGRRWSLCTPAGNAFYENSVSAIVTAGPDAGATAPQGTTYRAVVGAKYGDANNYSAWATSQIARLRSWGFNVAGEYSDWYLWVHDFPYAVMLNWMRPAMQNNDSRVASAPKQLQNGVKLTSVRLSYLAPTPDLYDRSWRDYYSACVTDNCGGIEGQKNDPYLIHIVSDDRDAFFGWGPGTEYGYQAPSYHVGFIAAVTSPRQWYMGGSYRPLNGLYADPVVYSKRALRDYLKSLPKYQSSGVADIAKLNAAWGSSYTTWDSAGHNYVESICAGQWNGVKTSCTATLSHGNVDPNSVGVLVNSGVWAGDHIHWNDATYGDFAGSSGASGKVAYAAGTLTISFSTPPPYGATVAIDYDAGGFGVGSGLLDEDGAHSWMGTDAYGLTNCGPDVKTDLDAFLYQYAKQYTSNVAAIIKTAYPGILFGGLGALNNSDGGKSRNAFVQAAAEDFDVLLLNVGCSTLAVDGACLTQAQAVLDDSYAAMGASPKPWLQQREVWANNDSPYSAYSSSSCYGCATTQAQRGQAYYDWATWLWSATDSATGDNPVVGVRFWSFMDKPAEQKNFGLISNLDNAYDGSEATRGSHACRAPLGAYMCGSITFGGITYGESRYYGDFLTPVRAANGIWLNGSTWLPTR